MKRNLACLVFAIAVTGCGGGASGDGGDPSNPWAALPDCDSIVEGTELTEDFEGCIADGNLSILFVYDDCNDGRELVKLTGGDDGEWRGSAFLPGPFLSWDVHGDQPWNECYGYD